MIIVFLFPAEPIPEDPKKWKTVVPDIPSPGRSLEELVVSEQVLVIWILPSFKPETQQHNRRQNT